MDESNTDKCIMTNDQIIYETALSDGMPETLSLLLVAQARHETDDYTSHFFTDGKNAFGYSYYVGSNWQLSIPGGIADNGKAVAQYSSVQNSVHEITAWIRRRQNEGKFPANLASITTPEQYAELLKNSGYYGDTITNYANGLTYWLRQISNELFSPKGAAISLLILLILVLFGKRIFPKKK